MTTTLEFQHPYNKKHDIPHGTRMLIVGTAPPPRFCQKPPCLKGQDFDFFYGSYANYMWEFLPEVLGNKHALTEKMNSRECVAKASELLKKHNMWMKDVLARFRRKRNSHTSALDRHIEPPKNGDFTNFRCVFGAAYELNSIFVTSHQTFSWLMRALLYQGLTSSDGKKEFSDWKLRNPSHSDDGYVSRHLQPVISIRNTDRQCLVYILPSPSPRSAAMTKAAKLHVYKQLLIGGPSSDGVYRR